MSGFFETLKGKFLQREKKRVDDFNSLAADLASGKKLDDKFVLDQLEVYRRSPEELQAAVERLAKRKAARAALDRARAVPSERAKITSQVAAAVAAYDGVVTVARQKLETETAPLHTRLAELDEIEKLGRSGEALLQQTAELPAAALAEIEQLNQRRATISHGRDQAARNLNGLDDKIRREEQKLKTAAVGVMVPAARAALKEVAEENLAALRPDAETLTGLMGDAEKKIREIDKRLNEIESQKLTP